MTSKFPIAASSQAGVIRTYDSASLSVHPDIKRALTAENFDEYLKNIINNNSIEDLVETEESIKNDWVNPETKYYVATKLYLNSSGLIIDAGILSYDDIPPHKHHYYTLDLNPDISVYAIPEQSDGGVGVEMYGIWKITINGVDVYPDDYEIDFENREIVFNSTIDQDCTALVYF